MLHTMLMEQRAQMALLQNNYAEAQQCILEMMQLQERFPLLLKQLRPSVHLAAGLYAHALDHPEDAMRHFYCAHEASADKAIQVMAAAAGAVAALNSGAPHRLSQAVQSLGALLKEVRLFLPRSWVHCAAYIFLNPKSDGRNLCTRSALLDGGAIQCVIAISFMFHTLPRNLIHLCSSVYLAYFLGLLEFYMQHTIIHHTYLVCEFNW